jgi:NitT/TauT family transport system substrate-binding protein
VSYTTQVTSAKQITACAACALALILGPGILLATDTPALKKVRISIGPAGLTCNAPLFVAYEKNFFKEEGLDAELIRGDWDFIKESLALGKIDGAQGMLMTYLKPIEQGLDVKFTAGVHKGCMHVLTAKDSPLSKPEDLKGKRIGVSQIGGSPWFFAARVVGSLGMDIKRDVEWTVYPLAELKQALEKKEVDAISVADPTGELLLSEGFAKDIVNSATDAPYKDEYCCVVVVSGQLIKSDPDTAARLTRAILKAAKWVSSNPQSAAEICVEKKYLSGTAELNARVLAQLNYIPSVEGGAEATRTAASAMQKAGILDASTDLNALVDRAFVRLPTLDDSWLQSVEVEQEDSISRQQIFAQDLGRINPNEIFVSGHRNCCCQDITLPHALAR